MNIYFSCSITGGRRDQPIYQAIVAHLNAAGHQIPTAHLAQADVHQLEAFETAAEVFERDVNWVRDCDALIAEVSTPSHGVGYEVALAVTLAKPVLCCYRRGASVSKMLLGNNSPGYMIDSYETGAQALVLVNNFLAACNGK
ncbi:MAG: nucleoside 2-deoxyribosyltransferase [Anaerolineaceae bacterium]|nr:nucleoside 2-deoxyribosyltransferase [Anaerolineaceae bacterium]